MAIISLFSGKFCGAREIVEKIESNHGYSLIEDKDIIARTAEKFNEKPEVYEKALFNPPSVFNSFTREKEKSIAKIKLVLSEMLEDKQIIYGFSSLLIPEKINHAIKILIIAEESHRIQIAKNLNIDEKNIKKEDEKAVEFCLHIKKSSPWEPSLYDMVLPMDKTTLDKAYELILSQLANPVLKFTKDSEKTLNEFKLESKVGLQLCEKGYDVEVNAEEDDVSLTINKKVLFLSKLENELTKAAIEIPGVNNVETKIGKDFYKADICSDQSFGGPGKVLLVDDEVDFIQTLSERLAIRDMPAVPVSSGKEALEIIDKEYPEVMVLDLKMPGIDGYEVLKKTKEKSPDTEIIILTGHGNDVDRSRCMELGAFAYLEKPADIDQLTSTMKRAYENIQKKQK
ncbi:MAG: response regulator [Deltaproteobacteria bacterium]|nr:MAG: response regulator [Deltaproteobacteria bacterium]